MSDGTSDPALTVAVTGGAGFIGSWIVKSFLDAGHRVRATLRDPDRADRTAPLKRLAADAPGSLSLHQADLLQPGSFHDAFAGCDAVVHCASPFKVQGIKDAEAELVTPALKGTENVLDAVQDAESVRRVVLTSSLAAIYGDAKDSESVPGGVFTESHWNQTSSLTHQAYSYSKTVAERAAWKRAEAASRWDLVTIHPGFVLGPTLTGRSDATSTDTIRQLMDGRMKSGVPDLRFGMVDVRDVARAHLEAAVRPEARGRYILCAESRSFADLAQVLRSRYGDTHPVPRSVAPKALLYLVGPFLGFSWKFVRRNVGIPVRFDAQRSQDELGIQYHPIQTALLDQATQLVEQGFAPGAAG